MDRAVAAIQIGLATWAAIVYASQGRVLDVATFDAPRGAPGAWHAAADRALEQRGHRRSGNWAGAEFDEVGHPASVWDVPRAMVAPVAAGPRRGLPSRPASSRVER